MPHSYTSKLAEHGFYPESYCFNDTVTGWDYDVINAIIDPTSVFVENLIHSDRQPDDLETLLLYQLTLKPNVSLDAGIEYLLSIWKSELRYQSHTFEQINLTTQNDQVIAHFLIISEHNAMTVKFIISHNKDAL